jgi:hypothetical protein
MSTFQRSELMPEHEILQNNIPAVMEEANQGSDPEKKQAEHGTELYQISDWKYCCNLLILESARVLVRDSGATENEFVKANREILRPNGKVYSRSRLRQEYRRLLKIYDFFSSF